ncbi:MAG: nucleoside hydrolase [Gemmatimonadales bacterium]
MPKPPLPPSLFPLPVVIDTDPGIDDCLALLLALASPELDVRGISVSYGNTSVEHAFRNTVEIVRRAGRRLPLAIGARRPLRRALAVALETHGESGLGYAEVAPSGVALDFAQPLERLLERHEGPVTLVTLGPLTSLALALRREPDLVRRQVSRHIAMVGSVGVPGNTTAHSEFNAWCDPEALDLVLRAELPTELVGLDVTRRVLVSGAEIERLGHATEARWLHDALRFYLEFHRRHEGLDACVVNDVLPIAALIRPDLLTFQPQRLVVDLEDGERRGQTRGDPEGARVRVATSVRPQLVRALLLERVLPWLGAATEVAAR